METTLDGRVEPVPGRRIWPLRFPRKWFARWRGELRQAQLTDAKLDDDDAEQDREQSYELDNKAHFEFSSAACRDFEATFSCPELRLKEVAMSGWKTTSKPTRTAQTWNDFGG